MKLRFGIWAISIAVCFGSLPAFADVIRGRVASERFADVSQGATYHLMLPDDRTLLDAQAIQLIETKVIEALSRRGYGAVTPSMLDSQIVVVVRAGIRPDRASIDDILLHDADPDAAGANGIRYLYVDAYDLVGYARFLRENWEAAGPDSNDGFLLWNTAAESHGALAAYRRDLPVLIDAVESRLGESAATTRFSETIAAP